MGFMKSLYDFYDIVQIISTDPKHRSMKGKFAVIRGKAQDEETNEWFYGVRIINSEGFIVSFDEKDLKSTGKKANPKDYESVGSIKVRVDPETGEGSIVEDDE
jgi:hypothetical protein